MVLPGKFHVTHSTYLTDTLYQGNASFPENATELAQDLIAYVPVQISISSLLSWY